MLFSAFPTQHAYSRYLQLILNLVNGRIILKRIFKKQGLRTGIDLSCPEQGTSSGLCAHHSETSGSIKAAELFDAPTILNEFG